MPSADLGAPSVRPADVEAWFAALGLTPAERADRDGITSWDLVLDGRRRFDLRITVICDPSFALICWAHYAPPITDMFRKSYRRLLRWNDEYPFAKFSISEDERPLLAVELPADGSRRRRARRSRSPASSASPTGSWTSRRIGCGPAAGGPTPAAARSRNAAFLDRYVSRLPELLEAEPGSSRAGLGSRRLLLARRRPRGRDRDR